MHVGNATTKLVAFLPYHAHTQEGSPWAARRETDLQLGLQPNVLACFYATRYLSTRWAFSGWQDMR